MQRPRTGKTHVPLVSGCNHWSDLWSCCTIAPAQKRVWTRQESFLYRLHSFNTPKELLLGWSLLGPNEDPYSRASVTKWMTEWGWNKTGLSITWTTLSEASEACRELLRCGCKNGCRGRVYTVQLVSAVDAAHGEQFITVWTQFPSHWLTIRL